MGIAARSGHFMDISISPIVWKLLVDEPISFAEDYTGIDMSFAQQIERIRKVFALLHMK